MNSKPVDILFSVGEKSADQHAAKLIKHLVTEDGLHCAGMGGRAMTEAGMECLLDVTDNAFMGFTGVLAHYGALKEAMRTLEQAMHERRPKLLVTVDFSGFNLRLAQRAQRLGIKVLMYIAPQVWASRPGRIKTIAHVADRVATILPFEKAFYKQHGVDVDYVGHPLIEELQDVGASFDSQSPTDKPRYDILLLPGSRRGEVGALMPELQRAAVKLTEQADKPITFKLLVADGISKHLISDYLSAESRDIELIEDQALSLREKFTLMNSADLAISASGTAVLQLALCATPTVVVFKTSFINFQIAKRIVTLDFISLPNILSQRAVIPELFQGEVNADRIATEAIDILRDGARYQSIRDAFVTVKESLGDGRTSAKVVQIIRQLLADQ